ncbi:hypothetical protein QQ045_013301 [Rhodiola kirilowii]
MASEDISTHDIGKFEGTVYAIWKMQIDDYLYGRKLYLPLSQKSDKMDETEWKLLDRQVKFEEW